MVAWSRGVRCPVSGVVSNTERRQGWLGILAVHSAVAAIDPGTGQRTGGSGARTLASG
jgi:hypothetical protein